MLGAYGASVRNGEYLTDSQIKLQNENNNEDINNHENKNGNGNENENEVGKINNFDDGIILNGTEIRNDKTDNKADDIDHTEDVNVKESTQSLLLVSEDESISTGTRSSDEEIIDYKKSEEHEKKINPIGISGKKSARRIEKAQSRHNVHISRQQLRDLLMSNMLPSNIHWNKQFVRYENHEGFVRIFFHDGTYLDSSLLVGADGIYSTVRKQLIPQSEEESNSLSKGLNYLGLMVILGISPILLGSKAKIMDPPPNDNSSFNENGIPNTPHISMETSSTRTMTATENDNSHNKVIATKRKRDDDDDDMNDDMNVGGVRLKHVDVDDKMNEEQAVTQVKKKVNFLLCFSHLL